MLQNQHKALLRAFQTAGLEDKKLEITWFSKGCWQVTWLKEPIDAFQVRKGLQSTVRREAPGKEQGYLYPTVSEGYMAWMYIWASLPSLVTQAFSHNI